MAFLVRKVLQCGEPEPHRMCEYYAHGSAHRPPRVVGVSNLPAKPDGVIRIVVISDTHELHRRIVLPPGDLLLHAGDILFADRMTVQPLSLRRLNDFFSWMNEQPHEHKIVVAGNHDHVIHKLGSAKIKKLAQPVVYAENEAVECDFACSKSRIRIFATPWSEPNSSTSPNRSFHHPDPCSLVPTDVLQRSHATGHGVDILMTHHGFICDALEALLECCKPRLLHVGGHVHECHGIWKWNHLTCVNGSMMTGNFGRERLLMPIVMDLLL